MNIDDFAKKVAFLQRITNSRKGEAYNEPIHLWVNNDGYIHLLNSKGCFVRELRVLKNAISIIERDSEVILKEAFEMEEATYQEALQSVKEASIEFSTGLTVTLKNTTNDK